MTHEEAPRGGNPEGPVMGYGAFSAYPEQAVPLGTRYADAARQERQAIAGFYRKLGALCKAHGMRTHDCRECPATQFCYTPPGAMTDILIDRAIQLVTDREART